MDNDDKNISRIRWGLGTAGLLALVFTLSNLPEKIDDAYTAIDEYENAKQGLYNEIDALQEEMEGLQRDLEKSQISQASRPKQVINLCNNYLWGYSRCENLSLSDGFVISIERNKASKRLIETVDDIRSGKRESEFLAPLPAEEAEQILLYNSLG